MRNLQIERFFLIISIICLSGCGVSPSPVEKRIELFNQLKSKIEIGDIAWVEKNSKDIFSLKIQGAKPDAYSKPSVSDGWGDDWWTIMRYRWDFAEDLALIYFENNNKSVKKTALTALKHFPSFYVEDSRYPNSKKRLISPSGILNNWERLSLINKIEIFTLIANETVHINYDLEDTNFLKDELCRAVRMDRLEYVTTLISRADFDVGLVRCYDTGGFMWDEYAAYDGNQNSCPMSLRRISGMITGAKINSRNNQFLNNLRNSNFDEMDGDVRKIESAFNNSFKNLPDLDGVDSMNDLLDKYNKWNAGGNCTTRDLLKSGVTLPKGW